MIVLLNFVAGNYLFKFHIHHKSINTSHFRIDIFDTESSQRTIKSQLSNHYSLRTNDANNEDLTSRLEREIKEDIRNLTKALAVRDQVHIASKRAFQTLDKECKTAISNSLKKLIIRERESNYIRNAILDKLENSVDTMNVDADISDFILTTRDPENALILQSQALNILNDLHPVISLQHSTTSSAVMIPAITSPITSNTLKSLKEVEDNSTTSEASDDSSIDSHRNSFSSQLSSVWGTVSNLVNGSPSQQQQQQLQQLPPNSPANSKKLKTKSHLSHETSTITPTSTSKTEQKSHPFKQTEQLTANIEICLKTIFYIKNSIKTRNFNLDNNSNEEFILNKSNYVTEILSYCVTQSNIEISKDPFKFQNICIEDAVTWLVNNMDNQYARGLFTTELNTFRSRQVISFHSFLEIILSQSHFRSFI